MRGGRTGCRVDIAGNRWKYEPKRPFLHRCAGPAKPPIDHTGDHAQAAAMRRYSRYSRFQSTPLDKHSFSRRHTAASESGKVQAFRQRLHERANSIHAVPL